MYVHVSSSTYMLRHVAIGNFRDKRVNDAIDDAI